MAEKTNKHSASEDSLGKLHGLVTKAFTQKVQSMLDMAEKLSKLEEEEEGNPLSSLEFIDTRTLTAAGKWVESNGIGCAPMEDDAQSELSKRLKEVRKVQQGKVVGFTRDE